MVFKKYVWIALIVAFFTATMTSVGIILTISNDMIGSSRVINYAGIVRGATQRLVKLEIANNPNDNLITYLDNILIELQSDEQGIYELKKLNNEEFQQSLIELSKTWEKLVIEVMKTRELGYENTDIIKVSEEHFSLADMSVSIAEDYVDEVFREYNSTKTMLIVATILLLITLLLLGKKLMISKQENKIIEQNSNIDLSTGLPNKSKCEQKFQEYGVLSRDIQYSVIMIDMNNLKQTNDLLGHDIGDLMISNFADILKLNLPEGAFAARFGGDEFIIVWDNITEKEIREYITKIRSDAEKFNKRNTSYRLSFAAGYSLSEFKENITLDMLLKKADKHMYIDKQRVKKEFNCEFYI